MVEAKPVTRRLSQFTDCKVTPGWEMTSAAGILWLSEADLVKYS